MRIVYSLIFFLFILAGNLAAQPQLIGIDVVGISLNKVLIDLREHYGLQLVFDDNLLAQFNITATQEFRNSEEALKYLIHGLPLTIEKSGDVFMIIPSVEKKSEKPIIQVAGQVLEAGSLEPLPFSYILVNNKQVQSDQAGNFTFLASADTSVDMRISHLGYYIYDTTFTQGFNRKFYLQPSLKEISEIKVVRSIIEKSMMIGDKPGKMKLNHNIMPYLPGYGDNSVFNVLRLMPGILASGEQSADLLIWGSYESHSKVEFDGFTLFGLKNFNDNIGAVNPLVLKDVEVFKGGYEARYGDRVGGIVNITGKNGSLQKPSFTFNINNTTVNSLLELPVSEKSSILAAYRQTFYELYDPAELNLFNRRGNNPNGVDFTLTPDYNFRDGNLKYSYQGDNTGMYVSLYGGGDRYSYNLESEVGNIRLIRDEMEKNSQYGGAWSLSHTWENGNTSRLLAAYSLLSSNTEEMNKTKNLHNGRERIRLKGDGENNVSQFSVSGENRLNFKNGYYIDFGLGFESSNVLLLRRIFDDELINMDTRSDRIFGFVQANLPVNKIFELKTGFRSSYVSGLKKFYPEPRLSASMKVTDEIKLNVSWGLYHQYLAKTSLVDSTLNYYYFWANADNENIPVLSSEHWVAGLSYNKNGFTASIEGYHKTTEGLSRFVNGTNLIQRGFYSGEGRSYGLDFYIKKEYKNHQAWVSYTLSKSEESFPFWIKDEYRPAPQDQRHEIKFAGILNFNSFYFSANYIYGSGFEKFPLTDDESNLYIPEYNRLDVALIYKFRPGKVECETGISVLNVLNTENIKLSNLRRVATDNENPLDVHAEAMPFSPTLFLKIKL